MTRAGASAGASGDPDEGRTGGRRTSPRALLAAAGLDPDRAPQRLEEMRLWGPDGPSEAGIDLLQVISSAAAPDDALHVLADLAAVDRGRFDELRTHTRWLQRLVLLAGGSRPLGEFVARHPGELDALRDPQPVDVDVVAARVRRALRDADGKTARAAAIAGVRRAVTAGIAARDLAGEATVDEVGRELADLAAGIFVGAVDCLHDDIGGGERRARLAVIAMGKLGGRELNYVSDVDVMFVHEPVAGGAEDARQEAEAVCRSLLGLLGATTPKGRAYEVDATLRPQGRDGPLSRTVASFVSYWQRWAETWEFQALLKARSIAGDVALGEELLEASEPFVFPENLDPAIVADVREMKGRVETKREVIRAGDRELKLGPGGIRDIEFAVQLLQLVHGRADRRLRRGGTLPTLDALAAGGYVAEEDAVTFAAAYRELRRVEHRLQLAAERRTHTLPSDPAQLERLARSLGHEAAGDRPAREAFLERIRVVQGDVRDLHAKLFYRPLLEMHASVPATDATIVVEGDGAAQLDEDAALTRLTALGFHDAAAVMRDIRALTSGVSRRARTLRAVLPVMLHALSESPDPDGGLRALRTLVESQASDQSLVAALRDQPPAADLLARMLGTSEVVGELLTAQPRGIEWLTDPAGRATPRTREELARAAGGLLQWQDDLEARRDALRRFKRRELARVVVRDLAGDAGIASVGRELTAIAEACLEAGLDAVLEDVGEGAARIAVIGLGKLGGRELHYISDLDVVFVHTAHDRATDADATTYAVRVAERVLGALASVTAEGTAFEVDAELRPEGRSGPLSRSLASYRTYYERWSEPWEHQALLRARVVAGDDRLGAAFLDLAASHAYPPDFDEGRAGRIRKLKARMERERVPERADASRHLKLGPGGLSDIEWTVQLLQQRHGHHEELLRTPSTLAALDALQDAGLLDGRDARWLGDGYRFLSRARNRLYLLRQRDVDVLPGSAPVLERLARSLGYGRGGRQDFEDDYLRVTRRVRRVTERLFYART